MPVSEKRIETKMEMRDLKSGPCSTFASTKYHKELGVQFRVS